jgi:hypothetical protein
MAASAFYGILSLYLVEGFLGVNSGVLAYFLIKLSRLNLKAQF